MQVFEATVTADHAKSGMYQMGEWQKVEGVHSFSQWLELVYSNWPDGTVEIERAFDLDGKVYGQNGTSIYRLPFPAIVAVRVE